MNINLKRKPVPLTIIDFSDDAFASTVMKNGATSLKHIKNKIIERAVKEEVVGYFKDFIGVTLGSIDNTVVAMINNTASAIGTELLKQYGLSADTMSFYTFRLNPNKLRIPRKKIISSKYTGAGWDNDTRGEEMILYSYSGTTGSLVPYNIINNVIMPLLNNLFNLTGSFGSTLSGILNRVNHLTSPFIDVQELSNNYKLSASYIKFMMFEAFWKTNNNDLLIIWEDNAYIGKFSNFSYGLDAFDPYQIKYDFDFMVYPDFKYNTNTGYLTETEFDKIQKTFNRSFQFTSMHTSKTNKMDGTTVSPNSRADGSPELYTQDEINNINWYKQLGNFPYNKNVLKFSMSSMNNKSISLSKITPKELSDAYRQKTDIDLFEDSFNFKMKDNVPIVNNGLNLNQTTGIVPATNTGATTATSNNVEQNVVQTPPNITPPLKTEWGKEKFLWDDLGITNVGR